MRIVAPFIKGKKDFKKVNLFEPSLPFFHLVKWKPLPRDINAAHHIALTYFETVLIACTELT